VWGIGVEQGSTIMLLHGVADMTGHPLAITEMVLGSISAPTASMLPPLVQRLPWNRAKYPTVSADGPWPVDLAGPAA
jgi:hypothetical protein